MFVVNKEMDVVLAGVQRQYGDWVCASGMVRGQASNSDDEDAKSVGE